MVTSRPNPMLEALLGWTGTGALPLPVSASGHRRLASGHQAWPDATPEPEARCSSDPSVWTVECGFGWEEPRSYAAGRGL